MRNLGLLVYDFQTSPRKDTLTYKGQVVAILTELKGWLTFPSGDTEVDKAIVKALTTIPGNAPASDIKHQAIEILVGY